MNVAENAAARGDELLTGAKRLMDKHDLVGDVRGKGLMVALETGLRSGNEDAGIQGHRLAGFSTAPTAQVS